MTRAIRVRSCDLAVSGPRVAGVVLDGFDLMVSSALIASSRNIAISHLKNHSHCPRMALGTTESQMFSQGMYWVSVSWTGSKSGACNFTQDNFF